jgi:hypothetical protein
MTGLKEEELYNYEILVFKFTSGDTVVSYADISDSDNIRLYRPLEVRYMTSGKKGHGLMPWMPFAESEVYNIRRKDIVVMEAPIKVMLDGYIDSCRMYDEEPQRYKYTEEDIYFFKMTAQIKSKTVFTINTGAQWTFNIEHQANN